MNPCPAFLSRLGLLLTTPTLLVTGTLHAQSTDPKPDSLPQPRRSSVVIRQSGTGNTAVVRQSGNGSVTTVVHSTDGTNTTTIQHDGQSSVTIDQQPANSGTNRPADKPTKKERKRD